MVVVCTIWQPGCWGPSAPSQELHPRALDKNLSYFLPRICNLSSRQSSVTGRLVYYGIHSELVVC